MKSRFQIARPLPATSEWLQEIPLHCLEAAWCMSATALGSAR